MKNIIKYLLFLTITIVSLSASAQTWIEVASTNASKFHIMAGSVKITKNDNNQLVVAAFGMVTEDRRPPDRVQWYVPLSNCVAQSGQLVITELNGVYRQNHAFNFNDNKVSSTIALVLCWMAEDMLKSQKKSNPV